MRGNRPDVFEVDDYDFLQLKTDDTTDENLERVKQAVASCPRAAISWRTKRERPSTSLDAGSPS